MFAKNMYKLFSKRTFSSITIVRHAESKGNELSLVQGNSPDEIFALSEAGRLSVQPILMHVPKPTVLVVSGLLRTIQTAEAWFGMPFKQIPIKTRIERSIEEINAGKYHLKNINSLKKDPLWQQWIKTPLDFPGFPDGENLTEFADRVLKGIASLCAEYGDSKHRVCVISHGVAMRVLKCFLAGQSLEHLWSHKVENLERIDLTAEQIKQFQAYLSSQTHTHHTKPYKNTPYNGG